MMSNEMEAYYKKILKDYPDVVDTETLCKVLRISDTAVRNTIKSGHLQYIKYKHQKLLFPKVWIMEFLLSDYYKELRKRCKNAI